MDDLVKKLAAMRDKAKQEIISKIAQAMKRGVIVVSNPNLTSSRCEYHVSPRILPRSFEDTKERTEA